MEKKYEFQKLTPSDNVDLGIYENALEYVFTNDDIKNIAISGIYGAGKSSMMESYKKLCPEKKFMHISLAHFEITDGEKENDQNAALEGKIINQLIHQIAPKDIPQTNFRIKKDIDENKTLFVALFSTIFIAITCFLRFKNTWENMINGFTCAFLKKLLYFTTTKEMEFVLGAVALFILGKVIYEIIILQKSTKLFRKFNFQGNEIEVFEESKDSYFDKYLNEVLYLFEHIDVDGIIFEDIDRYNSTLIFGKLREINYLLNVRNKSIGDGEQRKTIRFFYLLRDDIFESKDRTKFFDFILPIVPVVDASNAYDKFIEYFKNANLLDLFDEEFLQGLSLYVDDMRVLKNICNEFVIYYERLKTSFTEKSNNKLLAMITYKNLFPKDFGELQVGRGYVYTLFSSNEVFKQKEINRLQEEIEKLQVENMKIDSEMCNSIDELNALYFVINGRITVDRNEEKSYKSRTDFVKALMSSKNIIRYNNSYNPGTPISIDAEKKAMEENAEYIERKKLIERKASKEVYKNNQKIERMRQDIEKLGSVYLRDLITRSNDKEIFSVNYVNELKEEDKFEEIKRSPYFALITFLIRNGYIDETYPDYMTYFYANSITANDKVFLRSVTDKIAKPYDYEINNVPLVISRMRVVDFNENESLNIHLLDELLNNKEKYENQLSNLLANLWINLPEKFLEEFLQKSKERKQFVREFNYLFGGVCTSIIDMEHISKEVKRQYVIDTLCLCSDEIIRENNENNELVEFIEGDSEFISVQDVDDEQVKSRLKALNIKFKAINMEKAIPSLLNYVYANDLYRIEFAMIHNMLNHFYSAYIKEDIEKKCLSLIMDKQEEPLCIYIKKNLNTYIETLAASRCETCDVLETAIYVLNCEDVSDENKEKYIALNKTTFSFLNEINSKHLWSFIISKERVDKNIGNIYDYYYLSGNGMDNFLIAYVNSFAELPELDDADLEDKYGDSAKETIFMDIINCNDIDNDKYESLLLSFNLVCTELENTKLQMEKIDVLVGHDILEMNEDNLLMMRENYPDKCISFIIRNTKKYVEILHDDIYLTPEMLQLLHEKIDDELKIELLQYETRPISIRGKGYSPKIEEYIVGNLFDSKDYEYLVQWYPKNRPNLRKLIFDIMVGQIQDISDVDCILHMDLFNSLMQTDRISIEDKKLVIAKQIEMGMENLFVEKIFEQLSLNEYTQLLGGKRPKILASTDNEKLLNALLFRKWISSYEVSKDDNEYFQTYGRMRKKGETR